MLSQYSTGGWFWGNSHSFLQNLTFFSFICLPREKTTASASSWNRATVALGWSFAGATLTGRYVWWDGDNTDGDLTDWSKERQTATVTLWSPGGANWDWYLGWAYQDLSLDAPACIPVFDG